MFESNKGAHIKHTEKTNETPKGTKQEWVCFTCLEQEKR